jgi:dynein heavy chain
LLTLPCVQLSVLDVEKPLVERKLANVDAALQKGLTTLNWNSHKIEEYVNEVMSMVKELNANLQTIKGHVKKSQAILERWGGNLLFERKDGKTYSCEELSEAARALGSLRASEIGEGGAEISRLLAASNKVLHVSKGAPAWKSYVEYVQRILLDGLATAVLNSATYLFNQLDPDTIARTEASPLLEVKLELVRHHGTPQRFHTFTLLRDRSLERLRAGTAHNCEDRCFQLLRS